MSKNQIFSKISKQTVSAYQEHLGGLKLSEATIKRRLSSIRRFCEWSYDEGYLKENPFIAKQQAPLITQKLAEKIQKITERHGIRFRELPLTSGLVRAYEQYQSIPITKYLHYAILIIFCASLGFGAYDQFFRKVPEPLAYPPASAPVTPNRYLSFQGRLTDSSDNPITSSTSFRFALYNNLTASDSAQLWEEQRAITPDQDGIFSVVLGTNVAISASVFTNNASIWLGATVNQDSEMTPRQQIATVGYALNAETLQGIPPSASPSANKIPIITQSGDLVLAGASPRVYSTSGTFGIKGQALSITTDTGTNGNITIAPDGSGKLNLTLSGGTGNVINASDASLGSSGPREANTLYYGSVANNNTNVNLLKLESGSTPTPKFTVDAAGNASAAGYLKALTTGSYFTGDVTVSGGDITGAGGVGLNIGETSSSYVVSSAGFAVNGTTTYYFNSSGNLNANTGTFAGDFSQTGVTTFSTGTGLVSINGNLATSLIPNSTSYNLGSATNYWGAIYANNYYAPGTGVSGYWQRNLGALSPANITDDLLIGGTATASAKFQVLGTGASAGTVKIVAGQGIDTLAAGTLTIGGTTQTGLTLGRSEQSTTLAGNVQAFTLAGTITGSSSPNITSIGQFSGVTGVFSTSASSPTFQGNSAAVTFGNASYATTIAGSSTLTINPTSWTTTPTISGLITATLGLTSNGTVTVQNNSNFTQTGSGTFGTGTGLVSISGNLATSLIPNSTSYNLGSATNYWGAIYANNYYSPGTGVSGYWQRNLGTLAPTNITDDILVGGTATSSALVRLPGINNQNAWFNLGTGNVGIGTTVPGFPLDIKGIMNTSSGLGSVLNINSGSNIVAQANNDTMAGIYVNGGIFNTNGKTGLLDAGVYIAPVTGAAAKNVGLYVDTPSGATNNYAAIFAGGNVGIGTTGPGQALSVSRGAGVQSALELFQTGNNQTIIGSKASDSNLYISNTTLNGSGDFGVAGKSITLTTAGNVGIGTVSPDYPLQVNGTIAPETTDQDLGTSSLRWDLLANTINADSTVTLTGLGTGTDNTVLILDGSNNVTTDEIDPRAWGTSLVDYSGTSANYIPKMSDADTITNSVIYETGGNIGIGTTTPNYALDVAGVIRNRTSADGSPYTKARIFVYGGDVVDAGNWAYFGYGSDAQLRQVYSRTASAATMLWGTSSATDNTGTFTQTMSLTAAGNLTVSGTGNSTFAGNLGVEGYIYDITDTYVTINDDLKVSGGDILDKDSTTSLISIDSDGLNSVAFTGGNVGIGTLTPGTANLAVMGGNVGIGTTSPTSPLTVGSTTANSINFGTADSAYGFWIRNDGSNPVISSKVGDMYYGYGGRAGMLLRFGAAGANMVIQNDAGGNVGIGISPTYKLDVSGDINFSGKFREDGNEILSGMIAAFAGTCPAGWTEYTAAQGRTVVGTVSGGTSGLTQGTAFTTNQQTRTITDVPAHTHSVNPPSTGTNTTGAHTHTMQGYDTGGGATLRIPYTAYQTLSGTPPTNSAGDHSHTVDIAPFNSASTGVASVDVTMPYIQLTYCSKNAGADIAEWIPTNEVLTEKTIVSIDPDNREKVIASRKEYDPTVVGIIATQPGWLLGTENKESVQMALAGRVLTRVTLKNGEIKPGDPITTSSIPGVGMKTTKAGSIVGKAMEALNETSSLTDCYDSTTGRNEKCGTILVFVNISWYDPAGDASQDDLSADANNLFYEPLSFQDDLTNGDLVNLEYRYVPTENDPTKLERVGYIAKAGLGLENPIGVISTEIGGQGELLRRERINNKIISEIRLVSFGKTEVKIASSSATINPGDPITISSESGKGIKASNPGPIIGRALEEWTPDSGKDWILTFVSPSWYDPDVYLTSAGELNIRMTPNENNPNESEYSLVDSAGKAIERVGAFAQIAVAEIKAGLIETQELFAEKKIVSPLVETEQLTADSVTTDSIKATESQFGNLLAETVTSKQVTSDTLNVTRDATIAGTLYADEIIARKGTFGELLAATVSASQIAAADLTEIQTRLATLETQLTGTNSVTPTPDLNQPEASESALLAEAGSWPISDVSQDLKITSNLKVLGRTSLADTSIAGSLNVDGTLVIADSSINSLSGTLYLQNLGLGGVDIFGGKIVMDTNGNITTTGTISAGGLVLTQNNTDENPSTTDGYGAGTETHESGFGKLLTLINKEGQEVASIDTEGVAHLAGLAIASDYSATQSAASAEIRTNATSGMGILPAGQTEFTIFNPKVGNDTLVYITPVTGTQNKVLYVSAKKTGEFFKVAIDTPIDTDIKFNWWIIN